MLDQVLLEVQIHGRVATRLDLLPAAQRSSTCFRRPALAEAATPRST